MICESFELGRISPIGQNSESSSSIASSRFVPTRQHPTRANDGKISRMPLFVSYPRKKSISFLSSGVIMPFPKNPSSTNENIVLLPHLTHPHSQHTRDSLGVIHFPKRTIILKNFPKNRSNGKKSLHYPDFLYNDAEILLIVFYTL